MLVPVLSRAVAEFGQQHGPAALGEEQQRKAGADRGPSVPNRVPSGIWSTDPDRPSLTLSSSARAAGGVELPAEQAVGAFTIPIVAADEPPAG